ncbi:MAG: lipopolysaccharide heptosyltransferase I [Terriglobia bacterium]
MPERFLVIRLSSIGDIVHALPAVSALSEARPGAQITWAVESRYSVLLDGNPSVYRVLKIDTLGWRKRWRSANTLREVISFVRDLRRDRYDAVIDFQGLLKTGVLAALSRSPRRIGYAKWRHRELGAGLFYSEEIPLRDTGHVIEESLALVKALGARTGCWRFPLPRREEDERYVETRLGDMNATAFILVSPGGGWIAKRWGPENYARLIARMGESGATRDLAVVLTGSTSEERDIQAILQRRGNPRSYYMQATLGQYMALARRARLFVGGDTGPMHLAAALRVPVVALMGPTSASRNGPFSSSDIALSNNEPVNHTRRTRAQTYMEGISVDEVVAAVEERLARADERR